MYLVHPPVSHPYARQVSLTVRSGPYLLEQCCQIELPAMTEMFYICIVCLFVLSIGECILFTSDKITNIIGFK